VLTAIHGRQNLFRKIGKGGGSVASNLKEQLRPDPRADGGILRPYHLRSRSTRRHHGPAGKCEDLRRGPPNARNVAINANFVHLRQLLQRPETAPPLSVIALATRG